MTSKVDNRLHELLSANHAFAQTWQNPPPMSQLSAAARQRGAATMILTCLDPRCVPEQYFGPSLGAGVIRNAGGRATPDAIKSIVALRTLMDAKGILVVHHTDCGLTYMTDAAIREDAKARTPAAAAEVDALGKFGCFTKEEFEDAIREDVRTLRDQKVLEGVEVRGLAFDLEDGIVRVID